MKLYLYRGLENEKAPKDATHAIIDNNVTVIKRSAFHDCRHLVSVIMDDNVKRIETIAFSLCPVLQFIRLSKTLEYIGKSAFEWCTSLEALFLPKTLKWIGNEVFHSCRSLRLLILPHDIDPGDGGGDMIEDTAIYKIAKTAGVEYEYEVEYSDDDELFWATEESIHRANESLYHESIMRVNEWLIHHMDEAPFHTLCYKSSVTTKQINDYLDEHGNDTAAAIDPHHGMNPLHMLSMNPHAPSDAIAALLDVKADNAFGLDNQGKMPLDYARDYNVNGLIAMIKGLCNHRHGA